jgi:hypothetical protein
MDDVMAKHLRADLAEAYEISGVGKFLTPIQFLHDKDQSILF